MPRGEHPALLATCPNRFGERFGARRPIVRAPSGENVNRRRDKEGGASVVAFPKVPKLPSVPNGSASQAPKRSNGSDAKRKTNVLAFIREEAAIGNVVESQHKSATRSASPVSSLSEMLAAREAVGEIERRVDGRCKVIAPVRRELVGA